MKARTSLTVILASIALGWGTGSASSALLLSLDARSPGPSPATQWEDLSGNNQPFVNNGLAQYDSNTDTYIFFRDSLFTGAAGDEGLYDFDTDIGAGAGNGDAYTVVFYASIGGNQGNAGMVNKLDSSATGNSKGWHAGLSQDEFGLNNVYTEQRVANGNRTIIRVPGSAADPSPNTLSGIGVTATDLNLYVVHVSGLGVAADAVDVYINGSATQALERVFAFETLTSGSILNDDPLRIGGQLGHVTNSPPKGFVGDLQFIEIYSGSTIDNELGTGLTPAEYSQTRFANLGSNIGGSGPIGYDFTSLAVQDETALSFSSSNAVEYQLQFSILPATSAWTDVNHYIAGDGGTMLAVDPDGFSTGRVYRVIER